MNAGRARAHLWSARAGNVAAGDQWCGLRRTVA